MVKRFYLDASIWIDVYEDRKGYNDEPLGEFALKLLALIKLGEHKIIISQLLVNELEVNYSMDEINGMFKPFEKNMERIKTTKEQIDEARTIANVRDIPSGDVLHAIIARDNDLVLITRDNHFRKLKDISNHHKPEDLI